MIVVMVIFVLAVLAGTLSLNIKVETRLARNTGNQSEFEWLARSGLELARYVLAEDMTIASEPYDSLNQFWAGGPMGTNDNLAGLSLTDNQLGRGRFSVSIQDMERRFNINFADRSILRLAGDVMEVEPTSIDLVADCILDWIDPDDATHLSGVESDFYLSKSPPYSAKNGPVDDLHELLLVEGVTPEIFFGLQVHQYYNQTGKPSPESLGLPVIFHPVGLIDLFTPVSARFVNLNTTSASVLRLIPGIDVALAEAILLYRAGSDGMDGTEDDMPFKTVQELMSVPGMTPEMVQGLARILSVRSATYEVLVQVQLDGVGQQYLGLLKRDNPNSVRVLSFHRLD